LDYNQPVRTVILSLLAILLTACQPLDAPPFSATMTPEPQTWQVTLRSPAGETLFSSSRPTLGEALRETGLDLNERDFIWPPPETPLSADITVEYRPAFQILVRVDGQELARTANGETVGQALASAGIALIGLDFSLPAESDPLPADGVIQIVRVRETLALIQKTIPFQTQYVDAPETPLGLEEILAPGRPGVLITRTRIRYQDGAETTRFEEAEAVVQPAQDRLSGRGAKIKLQAVPGQENLQFWRAISMYATSYSPCRSGVPGRCFSGTASGLPVRRGVVAMSRLWYNQLAGAQIYIPGYGLAVVADVGGGFPDGRPWVDLGFSDDDFETWGGWVTVYFLAPAPSSIPYFLK
jgi:3D (Asp-Asp-Asp) domain-containing protein